MAENNDNLELSSDSNNASYNEELTNSLISEAEATDIHDSTTYSSVTSVIDLQNVISGSCLDYEPSSKHHSKNCSSIGTLIGTAPFIDHVHTSFTRSNYFGNVANTIICRNAFLPWIAHKEGSLHVTSSTSINVDLNIRPGEFVMCTLFADFTLQAERKIEIVMAEPPEKSLAKILQRGEDSQLDQLVLAFGSVAEYCLPSLLRTLFSWYERQMAEVNLNDQKKSDQRVKSLMNIVTGTVGGGSGPETVERSEAEILQERRDLAVEFIFCRVLTEVLKKLSFHPGHEDLVTYIENLAIKHFRFKEGSQNNPNAVNIHIVADVYAEVIGVVASSRYMSVRKRFTTELKELRTRELCHHTTQSIISLLMGMKFFRVKMVPIEEFEASFQFMHEAAHYFLEVKDKDIKHALAGLFVEILGPIADNAKNEVNVPCLKNFVEMLYPQTLDSCTKSKYRLALFPLVTTLLCVSQKIFFLQNWHYFLAMCLSHLKNKDSKMSRVALESLCRLIWVYMIRIKCESNSATQSRLQSIVNSIFPKGSKAVVPRDSPLFIFVKIIQFISYERLDFAMREIVFDLLSVGRPIKIIMTPERMNIGLRAFLVVADSLEQKEGSPPMPKTIAVLPSGNTLRVRKTFLNKMLTDDTAKSIGMSSYFPHVRRIFTNILRALDVQYGKPMMMTSTQNFNKDSDEKFASERKPRIDLFRTCIAAIPRLIPDGMTGIELVDLLSRLTVHSDEELRTLAYQSLQTLLIDFHDWRQDVLWGFTQFLARDVLDTFPQLLDNGLRMLLQLLTSWKNSLLNQNTPNSLPLMSLNNFLKPKNKELETRNYRDMEGIKKMELTQKSQSVSLVLYLIEAFTLVMLCNYRQSLRKCSAHILRETKFLLNHFNCKEEKPVLDIIDKCCPKVVERCLPYLSAAEKQAALSASNIDLQWIAERTSSVWTAGVNEDSNVSRNFTLSFTDPWYLSLFGFLEKDSILKQCPTVVAYSWPLVFTRVSALITVIDSVPVSDNRASLLRSSVTIRKPANERDVYIHIWRNYVTFAFCVVPPIPSPVQRCTSPDLSLGSSPDSLTIDRNETKSPIGSTTSPVALYKLIVPLLRCESVEIIESVINALGRINSDALKDLMDELVLYVREAVDRKQENVRRRRRRDALRLHLVRVFHLIAEYGTFGANHCLIDRYTQSLHQTFVEYIDGTRISLEMEIDKNSSNVHDIALHFCHFIRKMVKCFSVESQTMLLKTDLRRNLFGLFSTWAGGYSYPSSNTNIDSNVSELQFAALQAMSTVLCCGPCFDTKHLVEDGPLYQWLNFLLNTPEDKVYSLACEMVILLMECNPDIGPLLDWVVDKCYTGTPKVADSCFSALATIFSIREYPCDHYTAIINVALMNTGCPRSEIQDTAFQLLQILDKRFFGSSTVPPVLNDLDAEIVQRKAPETLDTALSESFSRSQVYLSTQLANLHPELTMPIFSEITHRFQTARDEIQQKLLQYLLPWLNNMELVDPNIPTTSYYQYFDNRVQKDGWGSIEATEMVLNNLFYLTTKFADKHQKEVEDVWIALCQCCPNNLKVIVRYLIIISGMSPNELLKHAKQVIIYLSHAQQDRLIDEMMIELQTIETLNCLVERTETPPFYRFTSMRKTSSHLDESISQQGVNTITSEPSEKGTIHTKRHSGEDHLKHSQHQDPDNIASNFLNTNKSDLEKFKKLDKERLVPHPLPMPEYGGHFAPLTEYLPDSSQPISGFHRCNIAIMLLTDVIADGIQIDLTLHLPLLFHIIFLGMDHNKSLINDHCKRLLMNLLIVLVEHNDHLAISQILLNNKTKDLNFGLTANCLPTIVHDFTEPDPNFDSYLNGSSSFDLKEMPKIVVDDQNMDTSQNVDMSDIVKSLIYFLDVRKGQPLWNYEDITAKIWNIKSAEQIDVFLRHILRIFYEYWPQALIGERWGQISLQLGLSCSSRHYAGRSMQIFRSLRTPITSRMLSDILSRLVETVSEQGEDMQGYVTELLLTLESVVESLESEFRSLDLMKEIFKSTPNLNKDPNLMKRSSNLPTPSSTPTTCVTSTSGHTRSTSCSITCTIRKPVFMPSLPEQSSSTKPNSISLSRSRSAQSLKFLTDPATQDDKLTILTQLFWLSVSLLESDYEHEFLLALRLLDRVLSRFPLDRPDTRDKVDKLQSQLKWNNFIGVHALLLKGCCHPSIYEPVISILSQFTLLLDLQVVDPSQSYAFPMNIVALLPYLILHYEDVNKLCVRSAENIAQVSSEKGKKLENLATVMMLYSRRNFSKESFQWTKCVVKYLYDTYSHQTLNMLTFLVEMLEKGSITMQLPILNIIHCMMHYVDLSTPAHQPIYVDLLRVVAKYIEGIHWKEALKVLKLVVTRSSTLVAPPITIHHPHWESSFLSTSFNSETEFFSKKELPGRTMDFTFDLSQTPVIGRRFVKSETYSSSVSSNTMPLIANSPKRTNSMSPADTATAAISWKRPWLAQSRVRECLVNLLTACGQRVGLPKSPSVIFSQSSDLIERQSSITSSTEEVTITNNEQSNSSRKDDVHSDQFGVFKDFDFLEYESESVEGESTDNFNWGVRRRPLSDDIKDSLSLKLVPNNTNDDQTPVLCERKTIINEESSDDEIESESPLDEIPAAVEFETVPNEESYHSPSGNLREHRTRNNSTHSASTESSVDDIAEDVTPSNVSPNLSTLMSFRPIVRDDTEETWRHHVQMLITGTNQNHLLEFFYQLNHFWKDICNKAISMTKDSSRYLNKCTNNCGTIIPSLESKLSTVADLLITDLKAPFFWFEASSVRNEQLFNTLKYGLLEIQEHLETFLDRKDSAIECMDAVKTILKLQSLGESHRDYNHEDILLDLGKAFYKFHFQLLLLVESVHKLILALVSNLRNSELSDLSEKVAALQVTLEKSLEESVETENGTPTPLSCQSSLLQNSFCNEDFEAALCELIENENWLSALSFTKTNKGNWPLNFSNNHHQQNDDEISVILYVYCKRLLQTDEGIYIALYPTVNINEMYCNLFQISAVINDLENFIKNRDQVNSESAILLATTAHAIAEKQETLED